MVEKAYRGEKAEGGDVVVVVHSTTLLMQVAVDQIVVFRRKPALILCQRQ